MTPFDYRTVPPGTYLCTVAEVRAGQSKDGHVRWSLRLVVADGPFAGSHAAWDNFFFSPRGSPRLRRVLREFGIESAAIEDADPAELEGRQAMVEVREAAFPAADGNELLRNEVPYDGYRKVTP